VKTHRVLFLTIAVLAGFAAAHSTAQREAINPRNFKPQGQPYNYAIRAGETLYISGQGSQTPEGKPPGTFEERVKQCLQNVRAILRWGGMDLGNLASLHIYVTELRNLETLDRVYWQLIGADPPARTILEVAALPEGNSIEISGIAVADPNSKRAIWPARWPKSAHADPPGVLTGEMLYLSALGAESVQVSGEVTDFPGQVKQALENVGEVLAAAGMSHRNLVWVNPYLDDFKQYAAMNKVYEAFFDFGNTPGRGTIQVTALPSQQHVVFSGIAGSELSKRLAIRPRNMAPSSTASPGILYGDTLYLSAKSGFIPGQGIVTQDFELQLRQSMRNLLDGLEEAQMDFSNVVSAVVYLKDMKDYDRMNELYRTFFQADLPSRTTLQQSRDHETKTEEQMSFIAVREAKR